MFKWFYYSVYIIVLNAVSIKKKCFNQEEEKMFTWLCYGVKWCLYQEEKMFKCLCLYLL